MINSKIIKNEKKIHRKKKKIILKYLFLLIPLLTVQHYDLQTDFDLIILLPLIHILLYLYQS